MGERFVEHDFLAWLRAESSDSRLPVPIGDDAALVETGPSTLVALDTVVEGRHLLAGPDLPERMARKALRVNLSDIAAMGGRAETVLVGLGLPESADAETARRFSRAMIDDCRLHGVELAGGDTVVAGSAMFASVTVLGRPIDRPIRRGGGRPGDLVLVTGWLGGSILGHHESFLPRLAEAAELVRLGPPSAMADVSDGFLRDLANIATASGCGALVRADALPIAPAARELAARDGRSALDHALHDGEDFELVFTMAPAAAEKLLRAWKLETPIVVAGELVEAGLWLEVDGQRRAVQAGGFDHGGMCS
ncbi:MAG: thiamine-monophosphate kinase [Planctomycetes bacterium]|nr:thiamine-monophosphate kinase [Planctomycetota bacterium]